MVTDEYGLYAVLLTEFCHIRLGFKCIAGVMLEAKVAVLCGYVNSDRVIKSVRGDIPLFSFSHVEEVVRNMESEECGHKFACRPANLVSVLAHELKLILVNALVLHDGFILAVGASV